MSLDSIVPSQLPTPPASATEPEQKAAMPMGSDSPSLIFYLEELVELRDRLDRIINSIDNPIAAKATPMGSNAPSQSPSLPLPEQKSGGIEEPIAAKANMSPGSIGSSQGPPLPLPEQKSGGIEEPVAAKANMSLGSIDLSQSPPLPLPEQKSGGIEEPVAAKANMSPGSIDSSQSPPLPLPEQKSGGIEEPVAAKANMSVGSVASSLRRPLQLLVGTLKIILDDIEKLPDLSFKAYMMRVLALEAILFSLFVFPLMYREG